MLSTVRAIRRPRLFLALCLLVSIALGLVIYSHAFGPISMPSGNARLNMIAAHSPKWASDMAASHWAPHPDWGAVDDIPALRASTWPGSFDVSVLGPPNPSNTTTATTHAMASPAPGPALLMLHIFSMPRAESRRRRALIRENSPIHSVPEAYRHLVEIKFVLGRWLVSDDMDEEERLTIEAEEAETMAEAEKFGDLIRLDELSHGENMNEGKTLGWIRWVGRPEGRQAQWVVKCDDDTFPLLPNLLPILLELDPSQPTYIGTALGHHTGYAYYFEGMMYGFNWGVVKSIASAELGNDVLHRSYDEDAYTGMLMYNLPSRPDLDPDEAERLRTSDPSIGRLLVPTSPDPRTGLVRYDLGNRAGPYDRWWIASAQRAVAWHWLKTDEAWLEAQVYAEREWAASGKPFMWTPPSSLQYTADPRLQH